MKLTTELVNELAQIKAEQSELKKREDKLVPKIKKLMHQKKLEEFAPSDCPYKFVYSRFRKSCVKWKEEWKALAKSIFGKRWKKEETKVMDDTREWCDTLSVELNENYKRGK